MTLDQLLSFKNVFTVSSKTSIEIPIAPNIKVFYSTSASNGDGNIEISSVLSEQLELLGSLSFSLSNSSIILNDSGIGIEFSRDITEYSKAAVSFASIAGHSLSFEYTLTTTDKYNNSVSSSIGMTYCNNFNNNLVEFLCLKK